MTRTKEEVGVMSISRRDIWAVVGCFLLGSALLAGCWGGPSVATLEIVTVEPAPGFAIGTQRPRGGYGNLSPG